MKQILHDVREIPTFYTLSYNLIIVISLREDGGGIIVLTTTYNYNYELILKMHLTLL